MHHRIIRTASTIGLVSTYLYAILLTIIHATVMPSDVTAIAVPASLPSFMPIYLSYTSTSITISILTIIIQLISLLMSELYFSILVREQFSNIRRTRILTVTDILI